LGRYRRWSVRPGLGKWHSGSQLLRLSEEASALVAGATVDAHSFDPVFLLDALPVLVQRVAVVDGGIVVVGRVDDSLQGIDDDQLRVKRSFAWHPWLREQIANGPSWDPRQSSAR
jgi:hypothetical protein